MCSVISYVYFYLQLPGFSFNVENNCSCKTNNYLTVIEMYLGRFIKNLPDSFAVIDWLIDRLIDWLFISWQGRLIEAVMNDNETEALDCVIQGADCNRVNKVSCLFVCLFVDKRLFRSYGDVPITMFGLYSTLTVFEQGGIFIVPHL